MKVKIFTYASGDEAKIEKEFNDWMVLNEEKISIKEIQTAGNEYRFIIFVFYKELKES